MAGSSRIAFGGTTAQAGPRGITGPGGPKGPPGYGHTGSRGPTGASLSAMVLDNISGITVLKQTFKDGEILFSDAIRGPTGEQIFNIKGVNRSTAGVTVFKSVTDRTNVTLRSLESKVSNDILFIGVPNADNDELIIDYSPLGAELGITPDAAGTTYANGLITIERGVPISIKNTEYHPDTDSVSFIVKDYRESLKNLNLPAPITIEGVSGISMEIDPNEATVQIVTAATGGTVPGAGAKPATFFLKDAKGNKSFTLLVSGSTGTSPTTTRFRGNVVFPYNKEPCFSGGTDGFNFFWYQDSWYGNLVKWGGLTADGDNLGVTAFGCNNIDISEFYSNDPSNSRIVQLSGVTGACCKGNGECSIESAYSCVGFFFGEGSTCGVSGASSGYACDAVGACCIRNSSYNTYNCILASCDTCLSIERRNSSLQTVFHGGESDCEDVNCEQSFLDLGACCTGIGSCNQLSEFECDESGGFFRGVGTNCIDSDTNSICSTGTGSCCLPSGCTNGYNFDTCLAQGGLFAGSGSTCSLTTCPSRGEVSCYGSVNGIELSPGDEYAGGVVVGVYNPYFGDVLGAKQCFSPGAVGLTSAIMATGGISGEYYKSNYDYHGYGFGDTNTTKACTDYNDLTIPVSGESRPDSYLMVVALNDTSFGATQEFLWSNRGSAFGPIMDYTDVRKNHGIYDTEYADLGNKKEGYWRGKTGDTLLTLLNSTFSTCGTSRKYGNSWHYRIKSYSPQGANGYWTRNWGLYNTIRMAHAENILHLGITGEGNKFSHVNYGPQATGGIVSIRGINAYNDGLTSDIQGNTANPSNVSQWFIPSHDELSFLAAHCTTDGTSPYGDFNLNSHILIAGGDPLLGWRWSSTGSFDVDSNEGISSDGMTSGSVAWATFFPDAGNKNKFIVERKNRYANKYKVRPVRLIRCDGLSGGTFDNTDKAWNVPKIYRDS